MFIIVCKCLGRAWSTKPSISKRFGWTNRTPIEPSSNRIPFRLLGSGRNSSTDTRNSVGALRIPRKGLFSLRRMVHLLSRSSLGTSSAGLDLGWDLPPGDLVGNDLLQYETRPVDLRPMRQRSGQSSPLLHHRSVLLFEHRLSVFLCILHDLPYSNLELFLFVPLSFDRREQFNLRRDLPLPTDGPAELQLPRHDPLGSSDHQQDGPRRNHLHIGKQSVSVKNSDTPSVDV